MKGEDGQGVGLARLEWTRMAGGGRSVDGSAFIPW